MIVRPWLTGDTQQLQIQSAQKYMLGLPEMSADLSRLAQKGLAFTAEQHGDVLAIAGVTPQWENRALAWALIGDCAGQHFPSIHKAVRRFLERAPYRRIEASVDVGFEQGHRWIKMLGFEIEGYMRAYRPDGADMLLYARIK